MKWADMKPIQRNALVAEKIMGWQWVPFIFHDCGLEDQLWLLPDVMATHGITPGEWTWAIEESEIYPEGSPFPLAHKDNHILPTWIPNYTTSMDAAWRVLQYMVEHYCVNHPQRNEVWQRFCEANWKECEAKYTVNGNIYRWIADWTPEWICLAGLHAVGCEVDL